MDYFEDFFIGLVFFFWECFFFVVGVDGLYGGGVLDFMDVVVL